MVFKLCRNRVQKKELAWYTVQAEPSESVNYFKQYLKKT